MQVRMYYSQTVRRWAAECYRTAHCIQAIAGRLLKAKCGEMCPKHAGEFCKECYERRRERGNQEDRPRAGRPRKVPYQFAHDLATLLSKGKGDGQYYATIDEAIESSPALKEQWSQLGVSKKTLRRAVLRANPDLVQRKVAVKPILRQAHKQQREQAAHEGLKRGLKRQNMTLYLDECQVSTTPSKTERVWMLRGEPALPRVDANAGFSKPKKVHILAAVSPSVGAVGTVLLTGTTGFKTPFTVRHPSLPQNNG